MSPLKASSRILLRPRPNLRNVPRGRPVMPQRLRWRVVLALRGASLLDVMFVGPQAVCFTAGRGLAHAEQALEILAVAPGHPPAQLLLASARRRAGDTGADV